MVSLLWLAVAGGSPTDTLALVPVQTTVEASEPGDAPPIRLWLNNSRQFREGERARVQVETNDDGYLVVFNYDTDGRLRVLFPLDPRDDNLVRGGRRYEIQGRGDRETFVVGRDGDGMVFAAVSPDPYRLEEWEAGGNWDYTRLYLPENSRDPEADISDLVQRIASNRGFDYDLLEYRVYGARGYQVIHSNWYPRPYGYYDDYYSCDWWYRPSLFGCRGYPVGGWYYGGGGYYNPWRYGGGYYPWYRYPSYRNPNYRYPVVVGRPRGYTIARRTVGANETRPSRGGVWSGALPRGQSSESPVGYRPRGNDGRNRPDGDRVVAPRGGSDRSPSGDNRPRGRRSPVNRPEQSPNMERDPGSARGPADVGDRPARRSRDRDAAPPPRVDRAAPRNDGGRAVERPREDRPRNDRPRSVDRPRNNPPRESAPPRAAPRRDPPPSAARPSNGGGSSGGRRPRGNRP
jgi:hypothetical protein